jgi:phage repressor protein C with HTH and peptisase S24 domain
MTPKTFPMSLADNLKRFRLLARMEQEDLAKLAGVRQQYISDIETGKSLKPRELHKLAEALGIDVSQLDPERYKRRLLENVPPPTYGKADLPVYASAEGGGGAIIVHFDPISFADRPGPLVGVKNAYAIYIVGESMVPAYEPGDTAWINPNLPPVPNRDAIFYHSDENGDNQAMIKRLVRSTPKAWVVWQHNPPGEITLEKTLWPKCHIVIGKLNK